MSNMVIILANAYEEFCYKKNLRDASLSRERNEHNSSKRRGEWRNAKNFIISNKVILYMMIITILGIGIFITGALLKHNIKMIFVGFILYTIGLVIMELKIEKNDVENYRKRRKQYYKRMKGFNNILKYEFNINSREKVEYILKECEKTSKIVGQDIKIAGKVIASWQVIIYPLLTFSMTTILGIDTIKKSFRWQEVVSGVILLLTVLGMIILLSYIIQSVINPFINSNKNRIIKLMTIINDIYINEYLNDSPNRE
ncbi:hypothetical protein KQI30_16435 [Clostridium bornimense]|uniref:hypothetical protein n=1 Tax=Clostridium bornimense TaxID=1216932 RepID=UPI001C118258|nr:hypothetical protein [Clostridium bornimense]MBU5317838.1 hypothetical protein [Clostridium bornimense]